MRYMMFGVFWLLAYLVNSVSIPLSDWIFLGDHKNIEIYIETIALMLVSFGFYNLKANSPLLYGIYEVVFAFFTAAVAVNAYELAYFAPYQLDRLISEELQGDHRWLKWSQDYFAWFSVAAGVWVFVRALSNLERGLESLKNPNHLARWKRGFGLP
jgi:hypothetical protein